VTQSHNADSHIRIVSITPNFIDRLEEKIAGFHEEAKKQPIGNNVMADSARMR
jgi:hypothetical protein